MIRSVRNIPSFQIDDVEVSRIILGCDAFISWLYQGGDSPFRRADGTLNVSRVLDVMKTSVSCGVKSLDLPPPLVDVFKRLEADIDEEIVGLGALQEWTCRNFTLEGIPLENYSEEIKATVRLQLPHGYLEHLRRSKIAKVGFVKSFFMPTRRSVPLKKPQIENIRLEPGFFENRLELYKKLDLRLVQFGGIAADWLVSVGRVDLIEKLVRLIKRRGFTPVLICHWASMVLPICERELEGVACYILPLNKLWSVLTLQETLNVIKNIDKPVIAMKTLAQGALSNRIVEAYSFLFKEAGVAGALVGVSSTGEAEHTFSKIRQVLENVYTLGT